MPMSYLQTALSKYTRALLSSCEENKCALKKPKEWTHDTLILKGEDLAKNIENDTEKNIKMCDCIVFVLTNNDTLHVIIAELKSKTVHAKELIEKLTNIDGEKYNILTKRCGITIEDVMNF